MEHQARLTRVQEFKEELQKLIPGKEVAKADRLELIIKDSGHYCPDPLLPSWYAP